MTFTPIDIQTPTGSRRVEAMLHGQVAVHAALLDDGDYDDDVWVVTHVKSGFSVLLTESMVKATQAAIALKECDLDEAVSLQQRTGRYPRRVVRLIDRLKKKYSPQIKMLADGQAVRTDVATVTPCPNCHRPMEQFMEGVNALTGDETGELLFCDSCSTVIGTRHFSDLSVAPTQNMLTFQVESERLMAEVAERISKKTAPPSELRRIVEGAASTFVDITLQALAEDGRSVEGADAEAVRQYIWSGVVHQQSDLDGDLFADDGPVAVAFVRMFKTKQQSI